MQFVDFARAHGVEIDPGKLVPSERIQRSGTVDKPRSTNGAWYWDGARGWVFNWATEARVQWWEDPHAKPWTPEEKGAWKARQQAGRERRAQDHQRAAERASRMLSACQPAEHSYLQFKGFPAHQGLVAPDGALVVPMRSLSGGLQGLQLIRWVEADRAYDKKMIPGMKAKGAIFRLGDKTAPETILCEGYATGLSILAAVRSVGLRACVVVCFSAHNLIQIAPLVPGRVMVFADHDASGTGEAAAQATGRPYVMSATLGQDANDLHQSGGLLAVCHLLMQARLG